MKRPTIIEGQDVNALVERLRGRLTLPLDRDVQIAIRVIEKLSGLCHEGLAMIVDQQQRIAEMERMKILAVEATRNEEPN